MGKDILTYHRALTKEDREICEELARVITQVLTSGEGKVWHGHPVWFLGGNPIVGYSKQKKGLRLMFWSGADFGEEKLSERGKKFKDASIFYTSVSDIRVGELKRWLKKSTTIQWDYENIVKRKGKLVKRSVTDMKKR